MAYFQIKSLIQGMEAGGDTQTTWSDKVRFMGRHFGAVFGVATMAQDLGE